HGRNSHGDVAVPGDEDDRYIAAMGFQSALQVDARQSRQAHITDNALRPALAQARQEPLGRRKAGHAHAAALQQQAQRLECRPVLLNKRDGRHAVPFGSRLCPASAGRVKETTAPLALLWIDSRPPCASMIERASDKPSPNPSVLVVANGVMARSASSGSKPG